MDHQLLEYLFQFVTGHKRSAFEEVLRLRTRHLTVVLEDIYHPHNASACLRSCEAFGVQDVHIVENRHAFDPSRDIELGSAQWLTLTRHRDADDNTRACLEQLRGRGYRVVATSPCVGVTLQDCDVSSPMALWFGTEHEGLSQAAREAADETVRIPTCGFAGSLNISVAVAVAVQHLSHKLRATDIDWQLSEPEKDVLRLEWVRQAIPNHRLPIIEAEFARRTTSRASGE